MSRRSNENVYTVRQLARLLRVDDKLVHQQADALNLPWVPRPGVDKDGQAIVRRVYLRKPIDAALDEMGRRTQRVAS